MDNIETQNRFATITSVASHLPNAKRSSGFAWFGAPQP